MKRLITLVMSLVLVGGVAFALAANDHVRGVVIKFSAESNSITIRTAPNVARTLSLTDKTTFKRGAKTVHLEDLSVGDQVVIEVPPKTARALLIQIENTPAPSPRK
jgi:hypothetical protein